MKLIDATTAQRQLRELAADGFPLTFLADRLGVSPQGLGGIRSGRQQRSQPYTLHSIHRLHRTLHGTMPAQHGVPEGIAATTRLIAARGGWISTPTPIRKDNP
jgi:hypothetical protein